MQSNFLEEYELKKNATIKNFSHKKGWNLGMTPSHVEPPPIPLIKVTYDGKPDKYFIKNKLLRDLTPSTSDFYEFRISLFDNGEP